MTIKTIVSQGEYATSVNEAQNLKAQLAEAKITLDLQVLESGAYVDRWVAADFDAAVALNGGRPDPDGMYGRYFTSTGNLNKVAGYSSPELDALFAQGKTTSDTAARKQIYTRVRRARGQRGVDLDVHQLHLHRHDARRSGLRADGERLPAVPAHDDRLDLVTAPSRHGVVRKVGGAMLTLLGVAVVVFVMLRAIPGDQITANLGTEAAALTPAQQEALRSYYGLDQPLSSSSSPGWATCSPATSGSRARNQASVLELTLSLVAGDDGARRALDRAGAA